MMYKPAATNRLALRELLTCYYREGEDADTPQKELDDFIDFLIHLLDETLIQGEIAFDGDRPAAFALAALDTEQLPFSEQPGLGTILELGVLPEYRGKGLGSKLVRRAENTLDVPEMYVNAYPAAQDFWRKCGYEPTGATADNGLPIYTKHR